MALDGGRPGQHHRHHAGEGHGSKIADGDTVSAYLYLGNGTKKTNAFSDYDNGSPSRSPTTISSARCSPSSSRARRTAPACRRDHRAAMFGSPSGNEQLGIDASDSRWWSPTWWRRPRSRDTHDDKCTTRRPARSPRWSSRRTLLRDWTGRASPAVADHPVQRVTLKEGTGAAVKASDTVKVNYLGETYEAKIPFDESYSKTPLTSRH